MERKTTYKRIWFTLLLFILLWHLLFRRKGYFRVPLKGKAPDMPVFHPREPEVRGTPGIAGRTYYWVPGGKIYHSTEVCWALGRSKEILSGSPEEAEAAGRTSPCNLCIR